MEQYNTSAMLASEIVTKTFSTSFSSASKLFADSIRQDIYNIYGLVRIADEIVDTYQGHYAAQMLDELETETYQALKRTFSSNLIVHAFALTATKFGISKELVKPFFQSMRTDLTKKTFDKKAYQAYIYGSAEVVGLMCLKVYCGSDEKLYHQLKPGACALGSAFQKVNFLRDLADDYATRGRYYFPIGNYQTFGEKEKKVIISDIEKDFHRAQTAINKLPENSRKATQAAFIYYQALLSKLRSTSAVKIKEQRIRVNNVHKLLLLIRVKLGII